MTKNSKENESNINIYAQEQSAFVEIFDFTDYDKMIKGNIYIYCSFKILLKEFT